MKKYLFAAAVLAAVAAPAAQAQTLRQMRNEFVSACAQGASSGNNALSPQMARTLCSCTFDETGKQYGTRWKATLDAYDRTGNDPQFESRMRRNTEVCFNRHLNRR
ncbi:hypothetical protein [Eikenella corrodens]|uniref:Uncharacterized protein n=1 Tax=Eikenella corrodens TaxID=539 RepID=A0A3S9SHZ3_EIKCO|nr:hypothetical protein [Eikenella corrodens]AZR59127.1 hypothetical protein ELB75_03210 [Eikenella corrodens]